MILADIRVQLIIALGLMIFISAWLVPDSALRKDGPDAADTRILLRVLAGAIPFMFLAMLPNFYNAAFPPLPTGPAAAGNFWVWLTQLRDHPGELGLAALGSYAGAGLAWAVAHFWLYARRLGQVYVIERDAWLRANGRTNLDGISPEERASFENVLSMVKSKMLYEGDFPLQPLQQKRFFIANSVLWPLTLMWYLFADMAVDAARYVWFALRNWIHRLWQAGMAEYLADEATCRALIAEKKAAASAA
jgi:hypothetical protein